MINNMEYEFTELENNEDIKKDFLGYKSGLVKSSPGDWVLLSSTAKMMPTYRNMKVRPSDVWIVTYPKCGTTWAQEMIWQIANKVDIDGEGKTLLVDRFPFLEMDTLSDLPSLFPGIIGFFLRGLIKIRMWWGSFDKYNPSSWFGYNNYVEQLEDMPQNKRRFIKSHIPLSLLPPDLVSTAKVIYVTRNPRDVMISYFYHHRLILNHDYQGDLPKFANYFMNNQILMGPFFPHVEEGWAMRDNPNFLLLFYEDMKSDLRSVIDRVGNFLESELTDEQVERLVEHLDIKNFKNNPAVNAELGKTIGLLRRDGNFIRQGKVGGWKEEFANFPELEKDFENWIRENLLSCSVPFHK